MKRIKEVTLSEWKIWGYEAPTKRTEKKRSLKSVLDAFSGTRNIRARFSNRINKDLRSK